MAEPVLTIEHLTKRFGDLEVFRDISLDIHEGEVIVIVGPSGCGKSTLLRCINALEEIQGGEIRLCGELISKDSKHLAEMRQKIGMVFQNYELFPHKTVLDNILLAPMKVQKRPKKKRSERGSHRHACTHRLGREGRQLPQTVVWRTKATGSHYQSLMYAP